NSNTDVDILQKEIDGKMNVIEGMKEETRRYQEIIQTKEKELQKIQQQVLQLRSIIHDCVEKGKQFCTILQKNKEKLGDDYNTLMRLATVMSSEEQKEDHNSDVPVSPSHSHSSSSSSSSFFSSSRSGCSSALTDELVRGTKLRKTFSGHLDVVWSVQCSTFDSGRYLCSGSGDCTIRLWDVETTKQIQIFNNYSSYVYSVRFSPYHQQQYNDTGYYCPIVCSSSHDANIRFWDFETAKEFQVLHGHTGPVYGIQFSSFNGGRYLCSGAADKTIGLWDAETSKSLHTFNGHRKGIWCVEFSPLQSNIGNDNTNMGAIGGSGYTICSGSDDKSIRLWDIETNKKLSAFKGHEDWVRSVKYAPYGTGVNGSGATLCSGSHDKTIRLWDIRSGKVIHVFKGHTGYILCVEYSSSKCTNHFVGVDCAHLICSGSSDNTIRFWDVRTNKQLHVTKGVDDDHGVVCLQLAKSQNNEKTPNSKSSYNYTLCSGSRDGPIRLWGIK
ncbi:hypothetical protein RFI_04637, partial [Reticulomyxa filosa]